MNAPAPSAALDFCLQVSRAHASLQLRLDDALGTWHGMGHADFILLHELAQAEGGRMTVRALAAPLGLTPSAVLRSLLPLQKTGLLGREPGVVVLRTAGRRAHAEAAATVEWICAEALQGLEADALALASSMLARLAAGAASVSPTAR